MTVTNLVTRYENIINLQSNKMMSNVKTEKNRTQYLLRGILRWKEVFCCTYHKNRLKTLPAIHQCVIVGNSPWPPGWCWWALCARSLNTINWTLMYNFLHVLCGTGAGCWLLGWHRCCSALWKVIKIKIDKVSNNLSMIESIKTVLCRKLVLVEPKFIVYLLGKSL